MKVKVNELLAAILIDAQSSYSVALCMQIALRNLRCFSSVVRCCAVRIMLTFVES
jgi:hypothetical protein